VTEKEFYLDVDKSTSNWIYSLRLRNYSEQVGPKIATFNPYACGRRPGLMEKIVSVLNKKLENDESMRLKTLLVLEK